jgi:hypothetical protein
MGDPTTSGMLSAAWRATRAVLTAGAALTAGAVILAGCGGNGEGGGVGDADQLRTASSSLVQPTRRLGEAAAGARASDRASMVTLRAAADRAGDALRTAQLDLGPIATSAAGGLRTQARQLSDALADLESLADALSARSISIADVELAAERVAQASRDSATPLPRIDTARLVASLRRSRRAHAPARARGGVSVPVGPDNAESTIASAPLAYADYVGPAFQAKLPSGAGWAAPAQSQPTPGELFRTSVRGPGGLFAIIDYTPYEAARFGGSYRSRTQVGQTAFGGATQYVFQGGRLPECQRSTCVDYIINDPAGGGGFGVLAGGGSAASAQEIARTVAESVVPIGE